jgi:hypothetical protein
MTPLQRKLRIREGTQIVALGAPAGYGKTLGKLPAGCSIATKLSKGCAFVHLFVKSSAELARTLPKVLAALAPGGLLWISYPKQSSGIETDLTRDHGWEALEKVPLRWLAMISFDASWSAFLLQNAPPKAASRASVAYHENQAAWTDPKQKIVRVPDDLAAAFRKSARAKAAFDALSFTNRKEYVMWVVGAKREATRKARVQGTIEKLLAGRKNPADPGS